MCKRSTAAVGKSNVGRRVLWTRREFRIRILRGLIVLTLEVITHLVMCSGMYCNNGEGIPIYEVCADGPGSLEYGKMEWIADMTGGLTKCYASHNI